MLRKQNFTFLVEVINSNPNGDPDRNNRPRQDDQEHGLMSDGCVKRKIRDAIAMVLTGRIGYDIFVKVSSILAVTQSKVFALINAAPGKMANENAKQKMLAMFADIRYFGGILSTGQEINGNGAEDDAEGGEDEGGEEAPEPTPEPKGKGKKVKNKTTPGKKTTYNAGQVTGPVVIPIGRSIDPVQVMTMGITRCCLTNFGDAPLGKELLKQIEAGEQGINTEIASSNQMGEKHIVQYGLYRFDGFMNPHFALKTNLTERDMEVFYGLLENCWDLTASAARPSVGLVELVVWEHDSSLGNAPTSLVEKLVQAKKNTDGPPRKLSDYTITVSEPPLGVRMVRRYSTGMGVTPLPEIPDDVTE